MDYINQILKMGVILNMVQLFAWHFRQRRVTVRATGRVDFSFFKLLSSTQRVKKEMLVKEQLL